jgi:hypothetical protein
VNYRNPQREELQAKFNGFLGHSGIMEDVEIAAEFRQEAILSSNKNYCPLSDNTEQDKGSP